MARTQVTKCMLYWLLLLFMTIVLVLYLDGGFKNHTIPLISVVAFTDLCLLAPLAYSFYQTRTEINRPDHYTFFTIYDQLKIYKDWVAKLICILMKIAFEVMLFLHHGGVQPIPIWCIMLPVWTGLAIILMYLTGVLVSIQNGLGTSYAYPHQQSAAPQCGRPGQVMRNTQLMNIVGET